MLLALLLTSTIAASAASPRYNVLLIAVDDLRPQFGASYGNSEVQTPNIGRFFTNGTAMQVST